MGLNKLSSSALSKDVAIPPSRHRVTESGYHEGDGAVHILPDTKTSMKLNY